MQYVRRADTANLCHAHRAEYDTTNMAHAKKPDVLDILCFVYTCTHTGYDRHSMHTPATEMIGYIWIPVYIRIKYICYDTTSSYDSYHMLLLLLC